MENVFDQKLAKALALLQATGMWRANYEPPIFRWARRLGMRVRPPHFIPPVRLAFAFGTYFFLFLLAVKVMATGLSSTALLMAGLGGVFYGLGMAAYYAMSRNKYSLPSWSEL